jgi:predicted nucleotidyltransferase
MRLTHPLDDAFAGRSHVRVLRALDELPDGLPASARELARRSGLSHPTASKVLASFVSQGIVLARRGPRTDAFELNRAHVLVEKLRPLFDWERQLLRELGVFIGRAIEREAPGVSAAYLFGSVVRGELTVRSDIDLAVIVLHRGKIAESESALDRIAGRILDRFGNRLNVTIGSVPLDQLRRPGRPGHRLWASVAREGIAVIPDDSGETRVKRSHSA